MKFTDSHCHLDFEVFQPAQSELLSQCVQAGIHQIIIPSISPQNWNDVLTCHENVSQHLKRALTLYPALGIHPWYLNKLTPHDLDKLSTTVKQHRNKVVAIGETGIDITIAEKHNNLSQQTTFFDAQIALAQQHKLPLILHHRRSHQQVLKQLKQNNYHQGGILHAFSGSYQQAKQYIDIGFSLGIGGTITYERAQKTINTVKKLPLDSLVIETDAPAMPLSGMQGTHNTPLKLIDIFKCLCELRTEAPEIISDALETNISRFLSLSQQA